MYVVTFTGDGEVARRHLQHWIGSRSVFTDRRLRHAHVEDLRGIYLPAYLYSAVARTDFTAQIGEQYTESETYTTKRDGKRVTETRTVTKTEYRPLSGNHVAYVTDVVVSASAGISNAELAHVEPFDFRQIRRYAPPLISGWIAEEFSHDPDNCLQLSRNEAVDEVGSRLRRFLPGDSHSDLEWRTRVEWESIHPILVPVWVLALRYGDESPPLRIVINGQTGKVHGKAPLVWWKVAIAVAIVAIVAILAWSQRS
jgi:hypothetical protein